MSTDIRIWVGALATLAVYSSLFKANVVSRAVENLFVGMAAGYGLVMAYQNITTKALRPLAAGAYSMIVPLILGLLLFARFNKATNHLSRIPMAFIVAIGAALAMRGAVEAELLAQIRATFLPLNSINNLILVIGTIGTSVYFIYSVRSKFIAPLATLGKFVMMVAFGAAFGNAVQGRTSLFIGVVQYLFGDWLGLMK